MLIGASSSRKTGWDIKTSRDFSHNHLISLNERFTCLFTLNLLVSFKKFYDLASSNVSIILSTFICSASIVWKLFIANINNDYNNFLMSFRSFLFQIGLLAVNIACLNVFLVLDHSRIYSKLL